MAKLDKYSELINSIIDLVGGKENIIYSGHCVTRLRFNLKDHSRVDMDKINNTEGVLGAQWSGDQLQIIVGQQVGDVYALMAKKYNLQIDKEESSEGEDKKKFSISAILDAISGTMAPLLPMLIGLGLIKVLLILLVQFDILTTDNNTYLLLYYVGECGYYFLPIFVGATAAKKFGANMSLGMVIGAMIIFPDFVNTIASGKEFTFFSIAVYSGTYTYSIFPTLIGVYIMSKIEKFLVKVSPEILRSMLVPFATILIMAPLMFIIIAPLGGFLGIYLTNAILWLYDVGGFVAVALTAALMPFITMTGMHAAFAPYLIDTLATNHYEPILFVAIFISNINQGTSALAVFFKTKVTSIKSTALSTGFTGVIAGVTEPAMYGINLRYKTPMIGAIIGSLVGGAIGGILHVKAYAFAGSSGLLGLPIFIGEDSSNFLYMIIAVAAGMITTFIATTILYKDEKEN